MKLSQIFENQLIKIGLESNSKFQVIDELIEFADQSKMLLDKEKARQAVIEREQYLSTGLENGLAVPHGKSNAVKQLVVALGISKDGVDFESLDGKKSHLIFLIISPKDSSGPHIQTLAQIARKLKDYEIREQIIHAKSKEEILHIFQELDKEA